MNNSDRKYVVRKVWKNGHIHTPPVFRGLNVVVVEISQSERNEFNGAQRALALIQRIMNDFKGTNTK